MWRVIVHERAPATLQEMETHWSIEDLASAHLALDVVDALEREAAKRRQEAQQ